MKQFKRLVLVGLLFLTTVAIAIFVGVVAAEQYSEFRLKKDREVVTRTALAEMGTIKLGDVLDDYPLIDVSDSDTIYLSQFRGKSCLLVFVQGGCGICLAELKDIGLSLQNKKPERELLVICSDGFEVAVDIKKKYAMNCQVLFDLGNNYHLKYNINDTPFHVTISPNGSIIDLIAGRLLPGEILKATMALTEY